MEEAVREFDVRRRGMSFSASWLARRWEEFAPISRPLAPLSIDGAIWESYVSESVVEQITGDARTFLPLPTEADARRLQSLLPHAQATNSCVIATTTVRTLDVEDDTEFAFIRSFPQIAPLIPSPDWNLVGYDVTDSGGRSGLFNYGYTLDERPKAIEFCEPLLNKFGLGATIADALQLRAWTRTRVREVEWFYIRGLYIVDGSDPASVWTE